jgi:hypothetical protein
MMRLSLLPLASGAEVTADWFTARRAWRIAKAFLCEKDLPLKERW